MNHIRKFQLPIEVKTATIGLLIQMESLEFDKIYSSGRESKAETGRKTA